MTLKMDLVLSIVRMLFRLSFGGVVMFFIPQVYGASQLPLCEGTNHALWTNCYGKYYYPNGAHYYGEYRDGKANGLGTFTFPDGRRQEGFWSNDRLSNTNPAVEVKSVKVEEKKPAIKPATVSPASNNDAKSVQKCLRMGLIRGSDDYKLCVASQK